MIEANRMIDKLGKRKFVETASHCKRPGKSKHEQDRGIKGRVRYRMCEHGKWIIENYEPRVCPKCVHYNRTKPKDFNPYFNVGLGGWVESRADEKRSARRAGLEEAG